MRVTTRGLTELPKELGAASKALSEGSAKLEMTLADQVVSSARRRAARDRLTGRAGQSIRSQGPTVSAGAGVPWYGFADFGGSAGVKGRVKRPFVKGGRYLFPAVTEIGVKSEADRTLDAALENLR